MSWWLTKSPWKQRRIAQLRKLWGAGLSASEIARILGPGFSRCAVLGKIHRLGLTRPKPPRDRNEAKADGARAPGKKGVRPRPVRRASVPHRRLPKEAPLAGAPLHLALADLGPAHCRWPHGEGPYSFCGLQRMKGSSYCVEHDAVAWRPAARKRRFILTDLRERTVKPGKSRQAA